MNPRSRPDTAHVMARVRRTRNGFTLIEVLVALSLLSIVAGMAYSFYLFAHKQVVVREKKAFEFDSALLLLESLGRNMRECRATLHLDESQWEFLTPNGDTASYAFYDDTLKFNARPVYIGERTVPVFALTGFGNDSLLDVNGDKEISFREIDIDGDDRLTGRELEKLAWIRASICLKADTRDTLSTLESVKNNLAGDESRFETYFK